MPRATATHPFEFQLAAWASAFAERLTGSPERSFLLLLDAQAAVERALFLPQPELRRLKEQAAAEGRPWVFYDPFDLPEYTWLEWSGVGRAALERLVGEPLQVEDGGEVPDARGVMF